ncbi:hypothetical protein, partial [Escherichia coli]|uniref:hypothetical protein n=1 Tax=Escherichia coli TaxID=562 RepID=UPI00312CAA09
MNPTWLIVAGALGLLAGALANLCAERWSRHAPRISPWNAPQQSSLGRVPVLGWWVRRQEIDRIARWRWLRAAMVEIALAALFVYLAWAPAQVAFLRPLVLWGNEVAPQGFPLGVVWHPADGAWLLAQFV